MSDIKELYITLQKYFWSLESDLSNQLNSARHNLVNKKIDADIMLKPIYIHAKRDMLDKIQHDVNKIMEVYLYEE